jgi:hypothetical protein
LILIALSYDEIDWTPALPQSEKELGRLGKAPRRFYCHEFATTLIEGEFFHIKIRNFTDNENLTGDFIIIEH